MCDRVNVEEIVHEMLAYLELADYAIREEMVRVTATLLPHAIVLRSLWDLVIFYIIFWNHKFHCSKRDSYVHSFGRGLNASTDSSLDDS